MAKNNIGPGKVNVQPGNGPRRGRRKAQPLDIRAQIEKQLSRKIKGQKLTYLQAYTKRVLSLMATGNKQAARIYRKLEAYALARPTIVVEVQRDGPAIADIIRRLVAGRPPTSQEEADLKQAWDGLSLIEKTVASKEFQKRIKGAGAL